MPAQVLFQPIAILRNHCVPFFIACEVGQARLCPFAFDTGTLAFLRFSLLCREYVPTLAPTYTYCRLTHERRIHTQQIIRRSYLQNFQRIFWCRGPVRHFSRALQ